MDKLKEEQQVDFQDSKNGAADKAILKPLSVNNVLYYYYPIIGTASYTLLSINVINPMLRFSCFTKRDLTSFLLANSIFGAGCYLYSRPHLRLTTKNSRLGYSAFGSVVFCFSSVLLWAILRSLLPENVALCSAAGVASSYILIQGATNYIQFIDNKISK